MLRWFYVAAHLLIEATAARRDARVRFLKAQVEILRRKLGGNRVIPSPDDRTRLLGIGRELNHDVSDIIEIVTPRTYRHWLMELRQGREAKPLGRPPIVRHVREFVIRLARQNAGWGYRRIIGELRKLRLCVGRSTVRRILKAEGLTPSPTRRGKASETVWQKFIRAHVNTLVACDFFSKRVITPMGSRLAFSLVFIHVGTRRVFLSPPTYHPDDRWVRQQARNVMMWLDEQGLQARFLIHDRDTKFSAGFRRLFQTSGVQTIRTPLLAPDANAFSESWIGTLKRECLNHFLCFSLGHLDHISQAFVSFYNQHRPHQGLANRTLPAAAIGPPRRLTKDADQDTSNIRCQRFLGGLLRHYYRDAA